MSVCDFIWVKIPLYSFAIHVKYVILFTKNISVKLYRLDRENANGQIFLNNLIKKISGKDILTFTAALDHEGLELPHFNWSRANKLLTKKQKRHNDMQNKAESIAVLQRMRTETHKTMMARERKLASTRKKGKVDLVINSFNAKSLKNKQSALRHAMGKRKSDICVFHEAYSAVPPKIRGYTWF